MKKKKFIESPGDYFTMPSVIALIVILVINCANELIKPVLFIINLFRENDLQETSSVLPWIWLLYAVLGVILGGIVDSFFPREPDLSGGIRLLFF